MHGRRTVPLGLAAEVTAILRDECFGGIAGALEDLQTPDLISDPVATARDGAIFARLLEALDRREVGLPDEEARARVELLSESFDKNYDYPHVVATHDAHQALLDVLSGDWEGCVR
jgi:hypothetical protein